VKLLVSALEAGAEIESVFVAVEESGPTPAAADAVDRARERGVRIH